MPTYINNPITILIICILILSACVQESNSPLRVGTNIWPGYEPLYLAHSMRMWDSNDINVVEFASASEVLLAFNAGDIDVAALTLDEALTAINDDQNVRIILGTDVSAGADAILAKPHITQSSDLVGKRIGVESTAVGAYMLTRFLTINKLTLSDIRIVYMPVDVHLDSFIRGDVDAVITFEPIKTQIQELGGWPIFSSSDIPGEIVDVLVTRKRVIKNQPDQLQLLVDGWFQSIESFKRDRGNALISMAPRMGITVPALDHAMTTIKLLDRSDNIELLSGDYPTIKKYTTAVERVMLINGLLTRPVNHDVHHVVDSFVREDN